MWVKDWAVVQGNVPMLYKRWAARGLLPSTVASYALSLAAVQPRDVALAIRQGVKGYASMAYQSGVLIRRHVPMVSWTTLVDRALQVIPQLPAWCSVCVLLMLSVGGRFSDIMKLQLASDLHLFGVPSQAIIVWWRDPKEGRTGISRSVVAGQWLPHLEQQLSRTPRWPEGAGWIKQRRAAARVALKRALGHVGLVVRDVRDLRRLAATEVAWRQGLEAARIFLRHLSITTTLRYLMGPSCDEMQTSQALWPFE